jgi:hypothetical protein
VASLRPIGKNPLWVQNAFMLRINLVVVAAVFISSSYIPILHGDSFRCGRKLVRSGDSSGELLRVCGEPYHKDRGRVELAVNGINKLVNVERWHYKKSPRSLEHTIIVYRGNVEKVIVGGR